MPINFDNISSSWKTTGASSAVTPKDFLPSEIAKKHNTAQRLCRHYAWSAILAFCLPVVGIAMYFALDCPLIFTALYLVYGAGVGGMCLVLRRNFSDTSYLNQPISQAEKHIKKMARKRRLYRIISEVSALPVVAALLWWIYSDMGVGAFVPCAVSCAIGILLGIVHEVHLHRLALRLQ